MGPKVKANFCSFSIGFIYVNERQLTDRKDGRLIYPLPPSPNTRAESESRNSFQIYHVIGKNPSVWDPSFIALQGCISCRLDWKQRQNSIPHTPKLWDASNSNRSLPSLSKGSPHTVSQNYSPLFVYLINYISSNIL